MDSFTVSPQNQLSFNKMLETQIRQIVAALPHQCNGDPSQSPVQEGVRSIFTVFKEKAPKSTEGSLGGVGKDKKPNTTENFFLWNFLNASRMPHLLWQVLQSLQSHRWPKSSGMETVLLTDLKCDALARRINR
jgi:hypothetical protein